MWPGVPVTAWASMRPRASNTPAARSPDSRTMVLKAVRCSACAGSSTTAIRRLHMICLSIRLALIRLSILILPNRFGWRSVRRRKAVDAVRGGSGDQPVGEIAHDQAAIAQLRIADAAAARRQDDDALAAG